MVLVEVPVEPETLPLVLGSSFLPQELRETVIAAAMESASSLEKNFFMFELPCVFYCRSTVSFSRGNRIIA